MCGLFATAMEQYLLSCLRAPALRPTIGLNLSCARRALLARRNNQANADCSRPLKVGVCGWDMGHNAAGRVHTLACIYQGLADVQIMGFLYRDRAAELWEPIRGSRIPTQIIAVDALDRIVERSVSFVADNPLDLLHLSKPRAPNILIGWLYKLIWGAQVYVDLDDEELAFVDAEGPVSISGVGLIDSQFPPVRFLLDREWTRVAVGLVDAFDGVTVANSVLQARYGGSILAHARDEQAYRPSMELSARSRSLHQIGIDRKVVLFLGTPRPHKGLLETAQAISALDDPMILFVIVGEFTNRALKMALEQIPKVDYLFIGNRPIEEVPVLVSLADACVLLQSDESEVARFQTPAKLSDALAMGIATLVTPLPPLVHAIEHGAVRARAKETGALVDQLRSLLEESDETRALRQRARAYFERFLSVRAARAHIANLIDETKTRLHSTERLDPRLDRLGGLFGLEGLMEQASRPVRGSSSEIAECRERVLNQTDGGSR